MPVHELIRIDGSWSKIIKGGRPSEDAIDTFILGTTKPTSANTGLNVEGISPASLTTVNGNVTHAVNDTVYENIRFTGYVNVTGKRITYKNCWFNASNLADTALVRCMNSNTEAIRFENCLFQPSGFGTNAENALENCIFGHDFILLRCELSGGIDLIGLYSGVALSTPARNIQVLGCYMHDMTYFSPDSGHADNQTHNDGFQIHGGVHDFLLYGTRVDGTLNPSVGQASDPPVTVDGQHISGNKQYPWLVSMSCFMLTPANTTAGVNNFVVDSNWLGGGIVVFNWSRSDATNVRIVNNRWTRGSFYGDEFTILMKAAQPATITGNYYENTLAPWNGRKNG